MIRPTELEVRGLGVRGPRGQTILEDVNLTLRAGDVTALVGETGSGKTSLLNSVLGLLPEGLSLAGGEVRIAAEDDIDLLALGERERRRYLGIRIGYVPQDVRSGLNPLMTARAIVSEAARRGGGLVKERADEAMARAGLPDTFVHRDADRRPGRLSGGQCQRVLIAQAIVNRPGVLLLDEPTASLDPLARRDVRTTIRRLADDRCAVCLVTHDVAALVGLADVVGVMYLGRIVEMGPADEILRHPRHPYTIGLIGCVPRLDRRISLRPIPGESPSSPSELAGCTFHPRCEWVEARCRTTEPRLRWISPTREAACHVVDVDPR
jgi:oligopeptide/dipeptide ABC transporter ATP-binding protein